MVADLTGGGGSEAGQPDGASAGQGVLLRVEGRVQGVGFRAFVRDRARASGVAGWTCNLPDGAVAVAAAGPPEAVGALGVALTAGPPGAAVTRVTELGPVLVELGRAFAIVREPPAGMAGLLETDG